MINYCKCGSLKYGEKCSNKNCPEMKSRRRKWLVKGEFLTFGCPVTYEEASIAADNIKILQEEIKKELRII